MNNDKKEWAEACIALLKGPIIKKTSSENKLWNLVIRDRTFIDNYFSTIGLTLLVEESDGYAFLRQKEEDLDEDAWDLPRLIRRVPLTAEQTFLCVVLREALDYFETSGNLSEICVFSESEILDLIKDFSPNYSDELSFKRKIKATINKLCELGYLEDITDKNANEDNHNYEVKRIIRAIITPSFLEEFKEKLIERNKEMENEDD